MLKKKRQSATPATNDNKAVARVPFSSLPSPLQVALLNIVEQMAVLAAERYVAGLRADQ